MPVRSGLREAVAGSGATGSNGPKTTPASADRPVVAIFGIGTNLPIRGNAGRY